MDDSLIIKQSQSKTVVLQQEEAVILNRQQPQLQLQENNSNDNEPSPQVLRERLCNDVLNDTKWYGDSYEMTVIKREINSLRREQAKGENADPAYLLMQYDYMIRLMEGYLTGREKKKSVYADRHNKVKALCDNLKAERKELIDQNRHVEKEANANLHAMSLSRAKKQNEISNDAVRLEELMGHPLPETKDAFVSEKKQILKVYDKLIAHYQKESKRFCILDVSKKKRLIAERILRQFEKERLSLEKKHFFGEKTSRTWSENLNYTKQPQRIDATYLEQNPGIRVIIDHQKEDAYGIVSEKLGIGEIFTLADRQVNYVDITGDETQVNLTAEKRGFTLEEVIAETAAQDLPLMYSDKALEQLETAQIIDFIMGQTNRTQDSFEVNAELKNVENVDYLVITNVMIRNHGDSLGNESADDLNKEMPGLSTRKLFDKDDNLTITGYSYEVADKIIGLDAHALGESFINAGVSAEAVDAMLGRLAKVKMLLEKDKTSGRRSEIEKNMPKTEEARRGQKRSRIRREASNTYILRTMIQDVGKNYAHAEVEEGANDTIAKLSRINKKADKSLNSEAPVLEKRRRISEMIEADRGKYEDRRTTDVLDAIGAYLAMDHSAESIMASRLFSKKIDDLGEELEPQHLREFMENIKNMLSPDDVVAGSTEEFPIKMREAFFHYYFRLKSQKLEKARTLIRECIAQLNDISERSTAADEELNRLNSYLDELTFGMSGNLVYDKAKAKVVTDDMFSDKLFFVSRKDEDLFPDDPKITDLVQGNVGDCYLIAALASVVEYDPQFIKDHMKDNGDGTVTVKLYKPTNWKKSRFEPVTVTVEKTSAYNKTGRLLSAGAHGTLWVQLYEKALAASEIAAYHKSNTKYEYSEITGGRENAALGWILGSKGEVLFDAVDENKNKEPEFRTIDKETGRMVKAKGFDEKVESLRKKMKELLDKGAIVSAAAFQKFKGAAGDGGFGEKRRRGMASKHAYTVIGMEEIDGKTYVRVRNPWGDTISEAVMNELTGKVFYAEGVGKEAAGSFLMDISSFAEHIQRVSYVLKSDVESGVNG